MSCRILVLILILAGLAASPAQGQEYLWCFDRDNVVFHHDPLTSLLTIEHQAAMHNCCPDPVWFEVALAEGLVTVTELVGVDPPCDCICCFTLEAEVAGLPAGAWTVRFTWLNEEDGQWATAETQVVVPPAAAATDGITVEGRISACLNATAVPDPLPGPSWGSLKALYR